MNILLILMGPLCLVAGVLLGAWIVHRERANKSPLPTALRKFSQKIEVSDEYQQRIDGYRKAITEESARIAALPEEQIKQLAEFRGVAYDNSRKHRDEMIERIASARFDKGTVRA